MINVLGAFQLFCNHFSKVEFSLDLPKSSWRKERDDLSQTLNSWITQLDDRMVFGMADGTFDHNV